MLKLRESWLEGRQLPIIIVPIIHPYSHQFDLLYTYIFNMPQGMGICGFIVCLADNVRILKQLKSVSAYSELPQHIFYSDLLFGVQMLWMHLFL